MNATPDTPEFPDPGELPVIDWIAKDLIDVDHAYQRPEDVARADKIARSFSWSKFGAVVLVPKPGGRYNAIDGQQRVCAAKLHPQVDHVPAVIMPAVQGVIAEATSFLGINAERKQVSSLELYHARLAAGDEDAQTIANVIARAGPSVPRYPGATYPIGGTIAVSGIAAVIGRHGAMRAREFMEVLVKAESAPIAASQIKAVEMLMCDPEFAGQIDADDLAEAIKGMGAAAETEAKRFAATHCVPMWKGLANTWFQKCRKRRGGKAPSGNGASEAKLGSVRDPSFTGSRPDPVSRPALPSSSPSQFGLRPNPIVTGSRPDPVSRPAKSEDSPSKGANLHASGAHRTIVPHTIATARNVTASMLGDPAAGRSALDARRAG